MSKFYGLSALGLNVIVRAPANNHEARRPESTLSPAPGSALADDSPNVLSGRDRGFYDPDPPSPETVRQAWLWEMGLAQ